MGTTNYIRLDTLPSVSANAPKIFSNSVKQIADGKGQSVTAIRNPFWRADAIAIACDANGQIQITDKNEQKTIKDIVYKALKDAPFSLGNDFDTIEKLFTADLTLPPSHLAFPVEGSVSVMDVVCTNPLITAMRARAKVVPAK